MSLVWSGYALAEILQLSKYFRQRSQLEPEASASWCHQCTYFCSAHTITSLLYSASAGSSNGTTLLCNVSTCVPRPFVPRSFCCLFFDALHSLSHLQLNAWWPNSLSGLRHQKWACTCLQCQRARVHCHMSAPPAFATPDAHFSQIHIDLVGPTSLHSDLGHSFWHLQQWLPQIVVGSLHLISHMEITHSAVRYQAYPCANSLVERCSSSQHLPGELD